MRGVILRTNPFLAQPATIHLKGKLISESIRIFIPWTGHLLAHFALNYIKPGWYSRTIRRGICRTGKFLVQSAREHFRARTLSEGTRNQKYIFKISGNRVP
jgi:hypothetical protein